MVSILERRRSFPLLQLLLLLLLLICDSGECGSSTSSKYDTIGWLRSQNGDVSPRQKQQRNSKDDSSSDETDASEDDKEPCHRCLDWYNEDKRNTSWLDQLNREIRCPCESKVHRHGFTPVDQPRSSWKTDPECVWHGKPDCKSSNPGASGCLLSVKTTSTGARQQCCYSGKGRLLGPNDRGAGTPDRAGEPTKHEDVDVDPYNWCCVECKRSDHCDYYKQLRKGSKAHCKRSWTKWNY